MLTLPEPLAKLGEWPQFVCWYATPDPKRPGKMHKFPVHWSTGRMIDAQSPENWTTVETALACAPHWDQGHGSGVGFVITEKDPFFCVDIDDALQSDGTWSALTIDLYNRFPGAGFEVSVSGKGAHIWGTCAKPFAHRKKNEDLNIELYTEKRFMALTGVSAAGNLWQDFSAHLAPVVAEYFAPAGGAGDGGSAWTREPVPEWSGPEDDDELLRRAFNAGNKNPAAAFGDKATFRDYFEGRVEHKSENDQSLANHLAFWTGKNCERMERLMRRSGMVRDKWDEPRPLPTGERGNILQLTILAACRFTTKVAKDPVAATAERIAPERTTAIVGGRGGAEWVMGVHQPDFFAGCYYITNHNAIFVMRTNQMLKKAAFDVLYGGHMFQMDMGGTAKTDSAFDAFTQSRVFDPPIVDDLCFRPENEPGTIITEGIRSYVNAYVPHIALEADGDPGPFLDLLTRMLPIQGDRDLLLHYMASMVQNPGVKFQWWPVIQGTKGNAKTALVEIMTHAMGEHYTHLPNAHAMAKDGLKFNGWIDRKLFIAVEEIGLAKRRDFLDEFKVIVTNRRIPIEKKSIDQTNGDNRANGILMTNHPDGVPIEAGERRYAIFYCAQQCEEDLARDGMDGTYLPRFYDWLRGTGPYTGQTPGKHVVMKFLRTMPLDPAMDPAQDLHRAPKTSSYAEAIVNSYGTIEQEIMEAVEEGRPGFKDGWISSIALDRLFREHGARIPHRRRRQMMRDIGYDWHPNLLDGRVNNPVMPDTAWGNGKPRLYIVTGHPARALMLPGEVAAAYTTAQEPDKEVVQAQVAAAFGKPPPAPVN